MRIPAEQILLQMNFTVLTKTLTQRLSDRGIALRQLFDAMLEIPKDDECYEIPESNEKSFSRGLFKVLYTAALVPSRFRSSSVNRLDHLIREMITSSAEPIPAERLDYYTVRSKVCGRVLSPDLIYKSALMKAMTEFHEEPRLSIKFVCSIRFSQLRVNAHFRNGESLKGRAAEIANEKVPIDSFTLDVVELGECTYTLNNRTLWAIRTGTDHLCNKASIAVKVRIWQAAYGDKVKERTVCDMLLRRTLRTEMVDDGSCPTLPWLEE